MGGEREQWVAAMETEMRSLEANSTYTLEPTPPGVKVLPTRWVFKKKVGGDGEVKFKARLVAKGFAQQEGVDYTEVYAPLGNTPLCARWSAWLQQGIGSCISRT